MVSKEQKSVSRSQLIREYVASNPGKTPTEIKSGMEANGTTVSLGLIYQVFRSTGTAKPGKATAKAKPVAPKASSTVGTRTVRRAAEVSSSPELLGKMIEFVQAAGGLEKASKILNQLKA